MTIPELMYGAGRYDVRDYSGEYFTHLNTQDAKAACVSTTFAAIAIRNPAWSIAWPLLIIIFGLLAIGLPFAISHGVVLLIGWLLILSSATQLLHAFQSDGIASILWKSAVALLYLGVGIYFLAHSLLGIASLTLAVGFFHSRSRRRFSWPLESSQIDWFELDFV